MKNMLRSIVALSMATAIFAPTQMAFGDAQYVITDLGPLDSSGKSDSHPSAINASGQVSGTFSLTFNSILPGLFDSHSITPIGSFGGISGSALSINDSGDVVGNSTNASNKSHAFLFHSGTMSDLGTLGGTTSGATGINNAGDIVGYSTTAANQGHGFLIHNGVMSDLGTFSGTFGQPNAINDLGDIVGLYNDTFGNFKAFLLHNGVTTTLDSLGGLNNDAVAINNAGQIVGFSSTSGTNSYHAFLYSSGHLTDLGTLGLNSEASGINSAGQVVGTAANVDNVNHGVIFGGATPTMLDTLIDPASGWTIHEAVDINDAGVIAVWGLHKGRDHAALLTPVVAPAAIPLVPTQVTAYVAGGAQISLRWNLVPGATSYNVYRSATAGGVKALVGTAHGTTSYDDQNLSAGTTYYYQVAAVNIFGTSAKSTEVSATTQAVAPNSVTGIVGTAVDARRIQLNWNASGATSYQVYRGAALSGSHAYIGSTNTASYLDTNLNAQTTYYYIVIAVNAYGQSPKSDTVPASTKPVSAPAGVTATAISGSQIDLHWNDSDGANLHQIYRSTAPGGYHSYVGQSTTLAYSDTGLQPNTHYYYIVTAVSSTNTSFKSAEVSATTVNIPKAVTNLTATAVNCVRIHLAWTASTGATSYFIYRSSSAGASHTYIGTATGAAFDDSGLSPSSTAYYVVVASNSNGVSPKSAEVHATTPALPTAPTNLTASAVSSSRIDLHWTAAFGASSYQIYRATAAGAYHSYIGTTTSTQFGNTGLPASTSYYYIVVAVNSNGSGPKSNETGTMTLAH